MAGNDWYPIISADNHIHEPRELFQENCLAKFKERAPRVISTPKGDQILMGDHLVRWVGLEAMEEYEESERSYKGARYEEGRRGKFEAEPRKHDMVYDDVQGEVCYGFHYWMDQPDREVVADMCRVYNDWVLDFFKDIVDRSIAPAMLPSWDIDLSIAEAKRTVGKLGARAVSVAVPYVGEVEGGYCNPAYDRLWATIAELGVPVANHIGTGGAFGRLPQQPGFILKEFVYCQADAAEITMDFVSAGIFDRFPSLKVALVEGGVGWAPWYMLVMDRMWHDNGTFLRPRLQKPPSEYFRENILITFQEDPPGIRNLDVLEDCIAWGSDYPHMEGTFPRSRESIQKHMGNLPTETQRRLCAENAARFFGFDLDHIVKKYGPGSDYHKRYSQGDGGSIRVKD